MARSNGGTITYTGEQLERGRLTHSDYLMWRWDNPRAWAFMERMALDAARHERRIGAQQLIEAVRERDFVDEHGEPTRTNNSYAPIIARDLIVFYPHLRPFIELRSSVYDVIVLGMPNGSGDADSDEQREGGDE